MKRRPISFEDLEALTAEAVSKGGRLRVISRGHSMRPAILDGDEVELAPAGPEGWRLGDVALARTSDGLVLHRIVAMGEDGDGPWAELKGDASMGPVHRLPLSALLAKLASPQRPAPGPRPLLLSRLLRLLQQMRGKSSPSA